MRKDTAMNALRGSWESEVLVLGGSWDLVSMPERSLIGGRSSYKYS